MELQNKTIIITGAARVGQAVAQRLVKAGANKIALTYFKDVSELGDLPQKLSAQAEVLTLQADVSQQKSVEDFVAQVAKKFGSIDAIVNMAAPFRPTQANAIDQKEIDFFMHAIVGSALYFAQAAKPHLRAGGALVLFADRAVKRPYAGYNAYIAAKGAVETLVRVLAIELAPDIRVNAILPGPIEAPPDMNQKEIDEVAQQTLLNRWGGRDEIAKAVQFLLESDFVTGVSLLVDGGITIA